ncbi:hypothetical protein pdam_00009874, partial [Pocillopora damicornis]
PADRTGEDLDIIFARFKNLKAFERFNHAVLHQICYYGYYQDLEEGITLYRQGDIGCYWYVVLAGALEVRASKTGKYEDAEAICTLGPGNFFGESVLDDSPRRSTVITSEFCELLLIEKKFFRTIWERNKQFLEDIIPSPSSTPVGEQNNNEQLPENNTVEGKPSKTVYSPEALRNGGLVLRFAMLRHQSPKLIRDRELDKRKVCRCFVGSEAVDWLTKISPMVHGRFHAIAMLQALLEEGVITQVGHGYEFKDQGILYRFVMDENDNERPGKETYSEEDLDDVLLMLSRSGLDAQLRMALRKPAMERTPDDLSLIYDELMHVKALQYLSTMVKKELSYAFVLESSFKKGTVLFSEGEEGISWYIILKGSVNVVVHGKDVETNTVRLKEHRKDVLVLEKINIPNMFGEDNSQTHIPQIQKYSVMAGTPEKMVEYLLETRMDNSNTNNFDDHFLNDFLIAFPIFMTTEALCRETNCFIIGQDETRNITAEHKMAIKRRVVQMTLRWCYLAGNLFLENQCIFRFIEELMDYLETDELFNEFNLLKTAMRTLKERYPTDDLIDDIFRVFCADHTYTTVALPYNATAQTIINAAEERVLLGDDCILCEVKSSGERVPFKPNEICVTTGLSVNGRLFIAPREHLDSLTPTPEQEGPSTSNLTFLESVGSKELAYYITQYDYELFNAVNIHEYIFRIFGKESHKQITANLDLLLRRFNEVQLWVETQILLTQHLNKRVYLLKKFIKLAAHCKEYNNWYSFFAVVMALNSVAVSRLSQTWEKLPSKFRKIYEEFEGILEPSRNHRVYRLLAGKMKPPILPFMPLLIKDMTFTNVGNKTQFDDLVNFEKMRMISSTIRLIQYCRSEPFKAEPPTQVKIAQEITIFVRNFNVIDNERILNQFSHRLEPKKN